MAMRVMPICGAIRLACCSASGRGMQKRRSPGALGLDFKSSPKKDGACGYIFDISYFTVEIRVYKICDFFSSSI